MIAPPDNAFSRRRVSALAGTILLLLAGCQQAYFRALNHGLPPEGPLSFQYDAARGLMLDVYRPRDRSVPIATVVFFHGGSWRHGHRSYYRFVGEALASHGVLVVIPDYRKAPQAVFPAFMEDAAAATAWTRAHAGDYGGDRSRLYLMGHSAGAHIAALLATDRRYLGHWQFEPAELAGVIALAGPYDFLPINKVALREVFGSESNWPRTQPENFIDGDEPPFLLVHGESDTRVRRRHSEQLAARLRAAGKPVTLQIVPHTGHIGLVNGFYSPRFSPVLQESLRWMRGAGALPANTGSSHPR